MSPWTAVGARAVAWVIAVVFLLALFAAEPQSQLPPPSTALAAEYGKGTGLSLATCCDFPVDQEWGLLVKHNEDARIDKPAFLRSVAGRFDACAPPVQWLRE